jgi:hypothetical protein
MSPGLIATRGSVIHVSLTAAGFVVLASPNWLWPRWDDALVFPFVSVVFTLVMAALVASWSGPPPAACRPLFRDADRTRQIRWLTSIVAGAAAAGLVALGTHRFVEIVLLNPPDPRRGDMLTVIEVAGRRFLRGRDPYAVYQIPWQVYLPYGPPLWAPFLVPQALRIDLRLLTAAGELVVPICCGVIAAFEAARTRLISSASWTLLLIVLVLDPDLQRFATVGHTPVYWPLLPLLAILIAGERWNAAAAVLGVLVAGRSTMTAVVPVFLMAVWFRGRSRALAAALVLTSVVAAILLPFFLWDPAAMWRGMITNYVQGIKQIVWHSSDGGDIHTVGLTGWLLLHRLDRLVELSQACAMTIVYFIAWRALRRGSAALPWMGLALFAFSMTTVWPVYYVHFDVVLLLTSAAIAESIGTLPVRRALAMWAASVACAIGMVAAAVQLMASPAPSIVIGRAAGSNLLRQGFSRLEDDGARRYRWIVSTQAAIAIPRSSAAAADVVVTGQPFVPRGAAGLAVTAVLNGTSLGTMQAEAGWHALRFPAPAAAWRIGANELSLQFPPTSSLKELGLGDDPRHLTMAIQRVDIESR